MSNQIVTVNVTQLIGSAPNTLQQTGAAVSQGGTTLAAGATALITQVSDMTAILSQPITLSAIAWSSGTVTATTINPHGITTGQTVQGVIAGVTPTGYNGTFNVTATSTTQFTYSLALNPGSETVLGTFGFGSAVQLAAIANTFFAQSTNLAFYVLELGIGGTAQGVTALETYIANPSTKFYAYLLPPTWDNESTAYPMAKQYASTTSQLYFYVTTTTGTYSNWSGIKSVFAVIQSPSAPAAEFSAAAFFYNALAFQPSAANMVSPLEYTFLYGVTPYVLSSSLQTTLATANVNWVSTGAQGGISNSLIQTGNFMDGNPFNYWYSVDWMAINSAEALAAAVINGSNTPGNPLYYNQPGINNLQKVAQNVANNGISFGLVLAPATVTAVPFATYVQQNPANYSKGIYTGLSLTFTPLRGFAAITINLTASNIPA